MKKLQLIKSSLWLLVFVMFVGFGTQAQTVIAYWDQNSNDLPGGGFGFVADPSVFPQQADIGEGQLTVGGGITDETEINNNDVVIYRWIKSFAGSPINAQPGVPGGGSISLEGGTDFENNGAYIQFQISSTGFENLVISYATRGTATGFNSQVWSYSLDGVNFTDVYTFSNITTSFQLVTFDAPAVLDNQETVYFRVTFDGATASNGNNRVDNITFIGDELPSDPYITLFQHTVDPNNNTLPAWFGADAERGFTVLGDNIYIPSRTGGTFVRVMDRLTGVEFPSSPLALTGLTGGGQTFAVNDIEVSDDGVLMVGNLAINAGQMFRVYTLAGNVGTKILEFTIPAEGGRLGDKFTVVGSTDDGSAVIYAADATLANPMRVYKWTMVPSDKGWEFDQDPTIITLSGLPTSPAPGSAAVTPLPDGTFYWNANGHSLHKFNSDGTHIGTVPGSLVATGSNAMKYLGLDGNDEMVAVFAYGTLDERIKLLRIVSGNPTLAVLEFETPSMYFVHNGNGAGDIAYIPRSDGNLDLYVIATNNGLAGYRSLELELEFPVYPAPILFECPEPEMVMVSQITHNSATVDWMGEVPHKDVMGFEYAYAEAPSTEPEAGEFVDYNYVELGDLDPETEYDFYVRTVCYDGFSDWVMVSFTTEATTSDPAGSTCENPLVLTLPVINYMDNTEPYGNNYLPAWVDPLSNYLGGHDFVAQFVIEEAGHLSGSVAGAANTWPGIIIVEDCPNPDNPPARLVQAGGTSGGSFSGLLLEPGTYFAIVGTWPTPHFTDFTLNLSFEPLPSCPAPTTLTATNITPSSAHLGWTPGGEEVSWEYVVGPSPLAAPEGAGMATTDNPVAVTGLAAGTAHQFYVRANCGDDDLSPWAGPFSFTTQLAVPAPYFEGFATTTLPVGWSTVNFWTIGTVAAIPPIDGNYIRRNIFGTGANATGTILTVNVGPVLEGMLLSFDYALANWGGTGAQPAPPAESGNFVVSISTDFGANYEVIQTVPNNGVAGWQQFEYDLADYLGEFIKIRIVGNRTAGDYWLAFDNFLVSAPIACVAPTALTATNITNNSAHLGWTPGGEETAWEYVVGPSPLAAPEGAGIATTDNPVAVTGLESGTAYQFYVRAVCGEGNESMWTGPFTFSTQTVAPVPYFEGFATTTLPAGWSTVNFWSIGTVAAIPPIDGNYIRRNLFGTGPSATGTITTINIGTVIEGMVLSFDYALANWGGTGAQPPPDENSGNFVVSISTDFGANYSEVYTYENDGVAGWQHFEYDLAEYIGEVIKIRIVGNRTAGDYWLAFDNFSVGAPPTCPAPTALTATNLTTSSADLGWTPGDEEAWNIIYGAPGFDVETEGTLVAVTENPFTLEGLQAATTYEWYVQANCGDEDLSTWAGPAQFSTACGVFELPLAQNFDTTPAGLVPPLCWSVQTATNTWRVTSGIIPASPPHAMVTFYHATLDKNDWFFTPGLNLTAGNTYSVEFNLRAPGWDGDAEKLKVHVGTDANSTAMGANPVWDTQNVLYPAWTPISFTYVAEADGVHYFGWHAYSAADIDFIAVDDIIISEVVPDLFTVTFQVEDAEGAAITNAVVALGQEINAAGDYDFVVEPGTYNYIVTAYGYLPASGTIEVADDMVVPVVLEQAEPQFNLWVNQPYLDGGTAVTSVIDDAYPVDYELADNFWDVDGEIEQMVFYGLAMKFIAGTGWVEQTPAETEPFFIRFYDYETGTDELLAPVTGTYQIGLLDSFGDGWNNGTVTVLVNGTPVLSNITLANGAGPEYHNFQANEGDAISTLYTAGSWSAENYYAILDPDGDIIAESGGTWTSPGTSTPGNIGTGAPVVLEPNWANPLSVHSLDATVEMVGTIWGGQRTLYKFTVDFDEAVEYETAWVSPQIDANNGSGTWFLWLNSNVGDQFSWHRLDPVGGSKARGEEIPAFISQDSETAIYRGPRTEDFAFELYGGTLADAPSCVAYVAPANNATSQPNLVTLSWMPDPIAIGYFLYVGETLPVVGIDVGDVTSYQVEVDFSTTYQWKVVPYNAFGSPEDCVVWSFSTVDILPLPWSEDFTGVAVGAIPEGWSRTHTNWGAVNSTLAGGNAAPEMRFNWSPSATATLRLITPPLDYSSDEDYRLRFKHSVNHFGGDYTLKVLASTDGENWDHEIWSFVNPPADVDPEILTFNISELSGSVVYLSWVFEGNSFNINQWYIDDIVVEPIPLCPEPSDLMVVGVTSSSVEVEWTAGGEETAWEYAYGIAPFDVAGSEGIPTTNNPLTIEGLQSGTTYQLFVRAVCDDVGVSPWTGPVTFTTVFAPPFVENFNTTPFPPLQWQRLRGLLTEDTQFVAGALWTHKRFGNIAAAAPNSAAINIWQQREHWLITPSIDLGDGSVNYRLVFDIALTGWNNTNPANLGLEDYVAVVISTDNGQTWSNANVLEFWDRNSTISNTGDQVIIDLTEYSGMVQFGFYAERPTGTVPDIDFFVDNVVVEEIPTTPVFRITPMAHNFGNVEVGAESNAQTFTVTNRGIGILEVEAPVVEGTEGSVYYNAADFPASLEAFESVTFMATITPSAEGAVADNVHVAYNDGSDEVAIVPLTANGVVRIPGSTCNSPMVMTLPIVDYQDNTEAYGNDYNSAMITPVSSYLNGYDFVVQFTVDQPGLLTGSIAGSWTGLFIMEECPNPANPATTVAMATGVSGGSFANVMIQPGTYFAIVSTWPAPNFTDFTLNLSFAPLYTVHFHVTDAHTGMAIQGANVAIEGQAGISTDAAGHASILLTPNDYTANVSRAQYITAIEEFTVVDSDLTIHVALVDDIQDPFGLMVQTEGMEGGQALFSWNNTGYGDLFPESFEGGVLPEDWSQVITNTGLQGGWPCTWTIMGPALNGVINPQDGNYQAFMMWSFNHQDEWLITPEFTAPADDLVFWYYGTNGSPNADNYYVKVSTDGGSTWTAIWNASTLPAGANHYQVPAVIDLSAYAGQNIHIAWHNVDGPTNDGLWYAWAIDNISIGSKKIDVTELLVATGGDVSSAVNIAAKDGKHVAPVRVEDLEIKNNKAFVGYNVFLNDMESPVGFTHGLNHMFHNVPPGMHTAGVQSVYSSGVSNIVTIDFMMPGPNITFVVTEKLGYNHHQPVVGADVHFNGEVKQTDAQGWATFEDVDHGLHNWEIFSMGFFPHSGALLVSFPHMIVPVTLTVDNTSVTDPSLADIKVFPVPARTVLNVTSPENMKQLQIVNILGQTIYTIEEAGMEHQVNVASFREGMYFVRIITDIGIETRTIQIIK